MILMKDKKLPLVSLLSTILIGGYTIVLLCVGIVTIFLGRYAGGLITAGMNLTANSVGNGDYISGYLMLPGFLSALLGGMTGTVAFLLAAGMFLLFLLFLILLISSIVMLKKRKICVIIEKRHNLIFPCRRVCLVSVKMQASSFTYSRWVKGCVAAAEALCFSARLAFAFCAFLF